MSKGTEALDAAMTKHAGNMLNCQAANLAKNNADKAFLDSENEVKAAISAVQTEISILADESDKQAAPTPENPTNAA